MSPVEEAVYWTEYVVRHRGAAHLRPKSLQLSWFQLLNLDIIFAARLALLLLLAAARMLCSRLFARGGPQEKSKTE